MILIVVRQGGTKDGEVEKLIISKACFAPLGTNIEQMGLCIKRDGTLPWCAYATPNISEAFQKPDNHPRPRRRDRGATWARKKFKNSLIVMRVLIINSWQGVGL